MTRAAWIAFCERVLLLVTNTLCRATASSFSKAQSTAARFPHLEECRHARSDSLKLLGHSHRPRHTAFASARAVVCLMNWPSLIPLHHHTQPHTDSPPNNNTNTLQCQDVSMHIKHCIDTLQSSSSHSLAPHRRNGELASQQRHQRTSTLTAFVHSSTGRQGPWQVFDGKASQED